MQTGNDHGINSAVQGSQICHCEGASRPWQSREGTAVPYRPPFRGTRHCRGGACPSRCCTNDSHRLSLKWQPPPDGACSGAQRAPWRLAICAALPLWRKAIRFVIARSEATWQSRRTRPDNREVIGEIATAFPRLPRRPLASSQ